MEVEPQVHARGTEEEEEETEVEEGAPLIRKHKSTDGILNGKRNEVVPVVQLDIEKDEGGGDVAKPMVYFDEVERRETSDRTVRAITPSNGQKTDRTAIEEIVESMPIKHLVKEDSETSEVDFEAVLRYQNTHDLYCPNCNSCITRRVILRKRKRTVPVHPGAAKREKVDDPSDVVNNLAEQSVDAQPEVFGCLQCLSLFVRTATGYELLSKMFRGRDGHTITSDDLQNDDTALTPKEDTVPAEDSKNTNCLAFLLEWGKRETEVKDPGVAVADANTTEVYRFEEVGNSGKFMQDKNVATSSKTYILAPKQEDSLFVLAPKHKDGLLISSETEALPVIPDEKVSAMPTISHETRVEITSQVGDVAEINVVSQRTFIEGWDIVKAIVYGGLTESITSLGVTSSAAGGDVSTLSVVALGLANLVGGLFVIAHNILELKHDAVRYTEAIGQPQNFWRNTIVVIVSYIFFGLVSPITYGFSFRKSDNKDYKLIAVAVASLLCILVLALGKARVTDKSYIRRITSYAALGVAVSGVSYVVGVYVKKLLDELGWISGSQNILHPPSLIIEATGRASRNWVS